MPGLNNPPTIQIEVDLYLHVRVLIAIILGLSVRSAALPSSCVSRTTTASHGSISAG